MATQGSLFKGKKSKPERGYCNRALEGNISPSRPVPGAALEFCLSELCRIVKATMMEWGFCFENEDFQKEHNLCLVSIQPQNSIIVYIQEKEGIPWMQYNHLDGVKGGVNNG